MIDVCPISSELLLDPCRSVARKLRSQTRSLLRRKIINEIHSPLATKVTQKRRPHELTYCCSAFLNDSTIIAADAAGAVDIVTLMPNEKHQMRRVGSNLLHAEDGIVQYPYSTGLTSIDNGKMFCVGLSTGELRVYSGERVVPLSQHRVASRKIPRNIAWSNLNTPNTVLPPVRRYYRSEPKLSLDDQWHNPTKAMVSAHVHAG